MISVLIFKDINSAVDFDFLCNLISGCFISGCCSFQAYQFADSLHLSDCPWHGGFRSCSALHPKDPIPKELPCRVFLSDISLGNPGIQGPTPMVKWLRFQLQSLASHDRRRGLRRWYRSRGCSIFFHAKVSRQCHNSFFSFVYFACPSALPS